MKILDINMLTVLFSVGIANILVAIILLLLDERVAGRWNTFFGGWATLIGLFLLSWQSEWESVISALLGGIAFIATWIFVQETIDLVKKRGEYRND